jgi:DNA-binding transcriptional MerR regulator
MSDEVAGEPRHPIRVATARTGLSAHAVRAWELRYEAVTPHRSERGHRLYTDEDIYRLRLLSSLTEGGRRIGQVAGLGTAKLAALLQEDRAEESVAVGTARSRRPDDRAAAIARSQCPCPHRRRGRAITRTGGGGLDAWQASSGPGAHGHGGGGTHPGLDLGELRRAR